MGEVLSLHLQTKRNYKKSTSEQNPIEKQGPPQLLQQLLGLTQGIIPLIGSRRVGWVFSETGFLPGCAHEFLVSQSVLWMEVANEFPCTFGNWQRKNGRTLLGSASLRAISKEKMHAYFFTPQTSRGVPIENVVFKRKIGYSDSPTPCLSKKILGFSMCSEWIMRTLVAVNEMSSMEISCGFSRRAKEENIIKYQSIAFWQKIENANIYQDWAHIRSCTTSYASQSCRQVQTSWTSAVMSSQFHVALRFPAPATSRFCSFFQCSPFQVTAGQAATIDSKDLPEDGHFWSEILRIHKLARQRLMTKALLLCMSRGKWLPSKQKTKMPEFWDLIRARRI